MVISARDRLLVGVLLPAIGRVINKISDCGIVIGKWFSIVLTIFRQDGSLLCLVAFQVFHSHRQGDDFLKDGPA